MITYTDTEIEEERQDALARLVTEHEKSLSEIREQYENEFGYHEVLHTASIMMNNVGNYLTEHPAVIFNEDTFRLAHQAHTALFNLYQTIGEIRFKDDPKAISPDQARPLLTPEETGCANDCTHPYHRHSR